MIQLTYSNSTDLGGVYYGAGFQNKLFIDAPIVKPDYVRVQEGYENDRAVFMPEYDSIKKKYKFEIIAPEYIADTLTFMALHNDIKIAYTNGLYQSQIRNVEVNVNWEDTFNDCMATIEVFFEQDDQIVKTACDT